MIIVGPKGVANPNRLLPGAENGKLGGEAGRSPAIALEHHRAVLAIRSSSLPDNGVGTSVGAAGRCGGG
jgi:hypothetical protein